MTEKKLSPAARFKEMLDAVKEQDSFHVDATKVELSEQIYNAMEEKGVSEAELSRRLKVSRAYVNKILQGTANLTIESLVKISRALGCEFKFEFAYGKTDADILDAEIIYEVESCREADFPKNLLIYDYENIIDFNVVKEKSIEDIMTSFNKGLSNLDVEKENAFSEIAA